MIPFVAAGGILIALAFLLGGPEVANKVNGGTFEGVSTRPSTTCLTLIVQDAGYAGLLFKIGTVAFSMLVPILAGFIAYAMADRPGLVPGIVAGLSRSTIGAGFLGGLVGGLLAGAVRDGHQRLKVPQAWPRHHAGGGHPAGVDASSWAVLMLVVIGQPIAAVQSGLTDWLDGPVRQQRDPARRILGPDDGLRHGRPGQQGGLRLRADRPRPAATSADHGRGHGRRHDPAAGDGPGRPSSARSCSPGASARPARPPGCWAPRSSPRGPSRSPPPTRCGSSRR